MNNAKSNAMCTLVKEFVEFKYQVSQPGVRVRVHNNIEGKGYPEFVGVTDEEGYARDKEGRHPFLQPGTWYFFAEKRGWVFARTTRVVLALR